MDIALETLLSSGSRADFRPGHNMDIALEPLLKRPDLPQRVPRSIANCSMRSWLAITSCAT